MRLKRKEADLKQIVSQAQGAQTRLKYAKAELENLRKKDIIKCQAVGHENIILGVLLQSFEYQSLLFLQFFDFVLCC